MKRAHSLTWQDGCLTGVADFIHALMDTAIWQEIDEVGGYIDTRLARERHWPKAGTDEACLRRLRLYAAHEITRVVQLSVCLDDGRRGEQSAGGDWR